MVQSHGTGVGVTYRPGLGGFKGRRVSCGNGAVAIGLDPASSVGQGLELGEGKGCVILSPLGKLWEMGVVEHSLPLLPTGGALLSLKLIKHSDANELPQWYPRSPTTPYCPISTTHGSSQNWERHNFIRGGGGGTDWGRRVQLSSYRSPMARTLGGSPAVVGSHRGVKRRTPPRCRRNQG